MTGTASKARDLTFYPSYDPVNSSMQDQAIDMAADQVKSKAGIEKSITKSAIKSVL